jgi:hypothetical protein
VTHDPDASRAADAVDPANAVSGVLVHPPAVSTDTAVPVTGVAGPETAQSRNEWRRQALENLRAVGEQADEIASLSARVATLEARLRDAEAFARNVATNYDHDNDAHRYGTSCRVCMAEDFLARAAPRGADAP